MGQFKLLCQHAFLQFTVRSLKNKKLKIKTQSPSENNLDI